MTEATQVPGEIPESARKMAMACHLLALVGLLGNGVGFLLGPLIIWVVKKDEHPFIDEQGKEAINFQITMFIAMIISAILILVLIGFFLMFIVGILMVVFPIIAGIKANNGEHYRYPMTIRLLS
jgi:uncharacterized Tic20 family protein